MTIETHTPELEERLKRGIQTGKFHDVDELLLKALDALDKEQPALLAQEPRMPQKNFVDFLLEAPLSGSGMKLERQKDFPTPINL